MKIELLENLTADSVDICIGEAEYSEYTDGEGDTIQALAGVTDRWRAALMNDTRGRAELHRVLADYPEQLAGALAAWGGEPTVEAPPEPELPEPPEPPPAAADDYGQTMEERFGEHESAIVELAALASETIDAVAELASLIGGE